VTALPAEGPRDTGLGDEGDSDPSVQIGP